MTSQTRIGFVGMGTMGGPMARRLASSGFAVRGFDLSAERAKQAAAAGVTLAASPGEAARDADVVMSSLPDPAAVRRAYLGPDGVLSTIKAGATLIDLSTIDPETWREVAAAAAARKADCLDAPVSGGPLEAGNGKLVFLLGGEAAVLERVRPVLTTLGSELHHIGPLGSGLVVKIVNNMMSIANVAVAAEAMVLGVKAGVEPKRLFEILSTSGGRSHHFLKRFPNVLAGDFTPHFGIGLSRKDIALALTMAGKLEMPVPLASAVRQVYEAAHAQGFGGLDMAGVTRLYEQWTGVAVRGGAAAPPAR
ncbi:MAG TPA: NAD(P)-dependent oxidoreductase [Methylomirabilota bacterium]|nr:NAD(P)-dependent oxidoreductase [Methylomirabilota bacterium]